MVPRVLHVVDGSIVLFELSNHYGNSSNLIYKMTIILFLGTISKPQSVLPNVHSFDIYDPTPKHTDIFAGWVGSKIVTANF